MSPMECRSLIRTAHLHGAEAGRTDCGRAVWVKIAKCDVDAIVVNSPVELMSALRGMELVPND